MNEKDMLIVTFLRQNARESLTNMSKKTKIPISTIYERLRSHGEGIIQKHTSLIDFSKLGFNVRSHVLLRVAAPEKSQLRDFLSLHPHVNSLSKTNNGHDFVVETVFCNIKDMEDFMEQIEGRFSILDKNTHYIIEDIKREGFLNDPLYIDHLTSHLKSQ